MLELLFCQRLSKIKNSERSRADAKLATIILIVSVQ